MTEVNRYDKVMEQELSDTCQKTLVL